MCTCDCYQPTVSTNDIGPSDGSNAINASHGTTRATARVKEIDNIMKRKAKSKGTLYAFCRISFCFVSVQRHTNDSFLCSHRTDIVNSFLHALDRFQFESKVNVTEHVISGFSLLFFRCFCLKKERERKIWRLRMNKKTWQVSAMCSEHWKTNGNVKGGRVVCKAFFNPKTTPKRK